MSLAFLSHWSRLTITDTNNTTYNNISICFIRHLYASAGVFRRPRPHGKGEANL